jgi:hypothetical protein
MGGSSRQTPGPISSIGGPRERMVNFFNKSVEVCEFNQSSEVEEYLNAFPQTETALIRIMEATSRSTNQAKRSLLCEMPGIFYKLVGDFLDERNPRIMRTNRVSFRVGLNYQI